MVSALGHISGAILIPPSLSASGYEALNTIDTVLYWVAQLAGATRLRFS